MDRKAGQRYEVEVPSTAIVRSTYEGTSDQIHALRTTLRKLTQSDGKGGGRTSIPALLRGAGLVDDGGRLTYDPTALSRFINDDTKVPSATVARALYQQWVGGEHTKIDLPAIDDVFYHAALIAMNANLASQAELSRILCGQYFMYKRSTLNPDFFVRGLLTVTLRNRVVHVTETQYHSGGNGMPETEDVEEGYAVMKGNIIYLITRSNALNGATFTVIKNHPVRMGRRSKMEEITTLFGFRVGGQEYSDPTASPFAAERIPIEEAIAARKDRSKLGFIDEVPKLLRRHLKA